MTRTPPLPAATRWTTRRALIAHLVLVVWVPGCAAATWWQVNVALSGDALGWVYSVMWPVFAVFSVVLWWNIVHDDPDTVGVRGVRRLEHRDEPRTAQARADAAAAIARAEQEDEELAAYNAYLAELRRASHRKTWRQP